MTMSGSFSGLGRFVENRRKMMDLSREELGRMVGLAPGTIRAVERDERSLTGANLRNVLVALEVQENNVRLLVSAVEGRLRLDDSAPSEQELCAIEAIEVPVFVLNTVIGRIVAANRASESLMHLHAGTSIYEWLVVDPRTRALLGQEWKAITHGLIYGSAPLIMAVMPGDERERLLAACSKAPEWETLWYTRPPNADLILGTYMTDPRTGETDEYVFTAAEIRFPPRVGWWQAQLTPRRTLDRLSTE
ncbi:helix-turn-helix domain-containing protein [Nocardia nova]|uniref:helix-turn-helix domain-containing protein n=1 Tax=Nocardia nova TaxID=37330 RepID=UPI0033FC7A33